MRVLIAAVAAVSLGSLSLIAQSPSKPTYKAPRTIDGAPDLSGNWSYATYTPLERPAQFADKAFFTPEEAEAFVKARDAALLAQPADNIHYDDALWQGENYVKGVSSNRTSLVIDPPDGKIPPLTEAASRRPVPPHPGSLDRIADSWLTRTLAERCITWGNDGPPIMPVGYNNNLDILQGPGVVVVRNEMVHAARMIPVDAGRPHVGSKIRQWSGDSRGRWEGATLVVETTNLSDKTSIGLNGNGLRHSTDMVMTERITRVGADELRYEIRINDPKTYVAPFTISLPLVSPPGYKLLPYECLEGDYAMANALSAERAEDRALAEDARKGIVRPRKSITQDNVNAPRPAAGTPGAE